VLGGLPEAGGSGTPLGDVAPGGAGGGTSGAIDWASMDVVLALDASARRSGAPGGVLEAGGVGTPLRDVATLAVAAGGREGAAGIICVGTGAVDTWDVNERGPGGLGTYQRWWGPGGGALLPLGFRSSHIFSPPFPPLSDLLKPSRTSHCVVLRVTWQLGSSNVLRMHIG